jgi:adenylate kinase family enzyme
MPRIRVTGNAGVGKSTLAARIAVFVAAPVFGLDEIVWRSGWKKSEPDERIPKEQALCARPSWVIDGVSRHVRESADVIVFLDCPRRVSFWRCATLSNFELQLTKAPRRRSGSSAYASPHPLW